MVFIKKIVKISIGLKDTKMWYSKKYFKSKREVLERLIIYLKKALEVEKDEATNR